VQQVPELLRAHKAGRVLVVTSPSNRVTAESIVIAFESAIDDSIGREPTVADFLRFLETARAFQPDVVVGIGGGSPLDVAKLVAALWNSDQTIDEAFGIGNLRSRTTPILCVPTTAGTGSEVSPNAILLDERDHANPLKKGVISPFLVPDAAIIDPALTLTVPPSITAATGLDALTHCIEAYTNKFAQPLVDTWALAGIGLIARSLVSAVQDSSDLTARENVSLGALYGGLCLGPVNTAAVHALSYPLGSRYHVPHGHANAILLPHVFRFNSTANPERHAQVAAALGAEPDAVAGTEALWQIIRGTGLEMNLARLNVPATDIPKMAAAGLEVQRLMKNNPRAMTQADAENIFHLAFI
jgi:alcohol dehydrogenase class IV